MFDPPLSADILRAVATFLRERATPALIGHAAFEARVAANALEIAARQASCEAISEEQEQTRLFGLLSDETGDLTALNQSLCQRIADGTLTLDNAALRDHLWATTLAKLAVDQPSYSTYQAVTAKA